MSPKLKCHKSLNVTKTEISLKKQNNIETEMWKN